MSRHNRRSDAAIYVATLKFMSRHKREESLEKQLNNVATLTNLSRHSSKRSVEQECHDNITTPLKTNQQLIVSRQTYWCHNSDCGFVILALTKKNYNVAVSNCGIYLKKNYNAATYVATLKLMLQHKREKSLNKQLNNIGTLTNLSRHSSKRSVE